ncbi:MAG TPA: PIN domain-containing protein [Woeseiaceae bacterium]|nr:PIN domain-containing protein [Woeseiaceae bacterium]
MTLTDAGPLIALIDRADADHDRCVTALDGISSPLITTWPSFTEACYLIGDRAGWSGQAALWRMVTGESLVIVELTPTGLSRSRTLMEKYRDLPMDLADATLVAFAEQQGLHRIFTLDKDFRIYRLKGRRQFEIVP